MFIQRFLVRKITIWLFIISVQIVAITLYFYLHLQRDEQLSFKEKVQFIKALTNQTKKKPANFLTFEHGPITLNTTLTKSYYEDFNSSLCYRDGTDIKQMQRTQASWKCECLPNFHGSDCSQPEVIWRAMLTYRKLIPGKSRNEERKIIYVAEIDKLRLTINEIRVTELNETVDLFVFYETDNDTVDSQLRYYSYLQDYHHKILYLNIPSKELKNLWKTISSFIGSLRNDDLIIFTSIGEIPNTHALKYLKLYDINISEPIFFRYRWTVYGFFWMHPDKTKLMPSIVTVKYLESEMNSNLFKLFEYHYATSMFTIGDLNHFGGWFCEYCNDIENIFEEFSLRHNTKRDYFDVQRFIGNGVYTDGKTELLRTHRSRDLYYAPWTMLTSVWKFEDLLANLYMEY